MKKIKYLTIALFISSAMITSMSCSKKDDKNDPPINVENCNLRLYNLNLEMTLAASAYGQDRTETNCIALKNAAQELIEAADECGLPLEEGDEVYDIANLECP